MSKTIKGIEMLTDTNQKVSNLYLTELEKIREFTQQSENKKQNGKAEILNLRQQLAELNKQNMLETDPEKIKEIVQAKKDIRSSIEDYKDFIEADYTPIIRKMIQDADDKYSAEAEKEFTKFNTGVIAKQKEYEGQKEAFLKDIDEKIEDLDKVSRSHSYSRVQSMRMAVREMIRK